MREIRTGKRMWSSCTTSKTDPYETTNLAEKYPEKVADLEALLSAEIAKEDYPDFNEYQITPGKK